MIIGIDIDDTIADTYETSFAYAQRYTIESLGRNGNINHEKSESHLYLKNMHNWSDYEETEFFRKYLGNIIKEVKPITLVAEIINKLKKEGHKIVIITARWQEDYFNVEGETIKWLKDNKIEYDDIVFDANNKDQIAVNKKLDVFIDDSFRNCVAVSKKKIKSYLIESRTNQGFENENVIRVYSWSQIYSLIKKED